MKSGLAQSIWMVALCSVACIFSANFRVAAQTNNLSPREAKIAADDKEACIRNLKLIYEAIQAYRVDHKDVPNWLSDLVPQYINDTSVLICPACKRTGEAETSGLADPKIPSSYFFEFCPLPLGRDLPNDPTATRREWKRRQMGVVGSIVPLVRCRHHDHTLNLAFDGRIYESTGSWELLVTNIANPADLDAAKMFPEGKSGAAKAAAVPQPELKFEPRNSAARTNQIDLTLFYNAMFTQCWHGGSNNSLSSLPTGLQTFNDVQFDVRGLIQLGGKPEPLKRFPPLVKGIKIHQKCARLHFLHALVFGNPVEEGHQVGSYVVHFATNQMQLEIPIIYGREVRDWHVYKNEKAGEKALTVAWEGTNEIGSAIRLFETTWENVAPGVEIESVDFVAAMNRPAPFLVAITAE